MATNWAVYNVITPIAYALWNTDQSLIFTKIEKFNDELSAIMTVYNSENTEYAQHKLQNLDDRAHLTFIVVVGNDRKIKIDFMPEKMHIDTLDIKSKVKEPVEFFMVWIVYPHDLRSVEVKIGNHIIKF